MDRSPSPLPSRPRGWRWQDLYSETELLRAAVQTYTKPLFQWHKALGSSTDDRTLYDFARHGLRNLRVLHQRLATGQFRYRPGAARDFVCNGKRRTLYIYPWEEKIVDLLLYRLLNQVCHPLFSPSSYAYRPGSHGVDVCQARIGRRLRDLACPVYLFKRDISRFFDSIDHNRLRGMLEPLIVADDYLARLLEQRVAFCYLRDNQLHQATQGVPFGTPIACVLANLFLTGLDHALDAIDGLHYYRYADDLLGLAAEPGLIRQAAACCDEHLGGLGLAVKPSHAFELALTDPSRPAATGWAAASQFNHLGLQFRADGCTGLPRDKTRKIQRLFRHAWRRKAGRLRRTVDPAKRASLAVQAAANVIDRGLRNVAIVDYYLKHIRDERQLRDLDRWLAEQILAIAFQNGHKKGNFRRLGFGQLRALGLPSLVHRSRLIRHRQISSSFLRWKEYQGARRPRDRRPSPTCQRGTAPDPAVTPGFLPVPASTRPKPPVGEGDGLSTGFIEDTDAKASVSLSSRSPLTTPHPQPRSTPHGMA